MATTVRDVEIRPARPVAVGSPIFASLAKTEPLRVTVHLGGDTGSLAREKIELWSAQGPGSPGARRLADLPTELSDGSALFTLPFGIAVPPPRLTVVFRQRRMGATFNALSTREFERFIVQRVVRDHPAFRATADGVLADDEGRTLELTIEPQSSLVRDVMRVPVDVVHVPGSCSSTHNLMRAITLSAMGIRHPADDGSPVHVWETRVVGAETLVVPNLVARIRDSGVPRADRRQLIRVWRNPAPGHSQPGSVPIDPDLRLSVAARDTSAAARVLTRDLLAALDRLLGTLGTQRVVIDAKSLRTSLSTGVFTEDTVSEWLARVIEVSVALRRAAPP